jgi:hypothetical protein
MIQLLANRYKKDIAYTLSLVFFMGMIIPAYGMIRISTMTTGRFFYSKIIAGILTIQKTHSIQTE